jgi:hypothetical protein
LKYTTGNGFLVFERFLQPLKRDAKCGAVSYTEVNDFYRRSSQRE